MTMVATIAGSVVLLARLGNGRDGSPHPGKRRAGGQRGHLCVSAWLAIQSRGLVCERWRSFSSFYFDVGKGRPGCIC
jgi:hypothetical protein